MSKEALASAAPGPPLLDALDAVEPDHPVVEEAADVDPSVAWESNPADVAERGREVGDGDEPDAPG
jgi:hypothetical protein